MLSAVAELPSLLTLPSDEPQVQMQREPWPARRVDLNCDVGESYGTYSIGSDERLMAIVSSVNLACGFHAGDPLVIDEAVAKAARLDVAVGAHPGYPDLRGFGRRRLECSPAEVEADVLYQLGALDVFCRAHGVSLTHVKPHGALYAEAATNPAVAQAIARAVARSMGPLVLVGLAGSSAMLDAADLEALRFAPEAFADRVYNPNGTLLSRRHDDAVIAQPGRAAEQALGIVLDRTVVAHDGTRLEIEAETLCIHGDNPAAIEVAEAVRAALTEAGVVIMPLV
jgi:UPF0271 protein